MASGIIVLIVVLFTVIGKREPLKIQLPVHHPRNLQQDQKGMPGRFIILLVGNIAAIWATLIMVSVSVWVQAVWEIRQELCCVWFSLSITCSVIALLCDLSELAWETRAIGETADSITFWSTFVGLLNWACKTKHLKKNMPLTFRGANRKKERKLAWAIHYWFSLFQLQGKTFCAFSLRDRAIASGKWGINDPSWTLSAYRLSSHLLYCFRRRGHRNGVRC